ncbi:MAG TPA: phosphoenolpyruvate--protein phosphotransferase [Verrucomicrobiae bacterium]|nr:phosphoenolpyruvate--protein phosphotransferase [Verrucomicrobiae bacterium]
MAKKATTERVFQGIGVSPGVARGRILVYSIAEEAVPEYDITAEQVPQEVTRFEQALIATREQLHELQGRIASGIGATAPSSILDVHVSITEDPALIEPVTTRLEQEKKNVEFIFHNVAQKYVKTLAELPDEFLRERAADVQDVTRRILRNLLGHEHRGLTNVPAGTIIVAHDLSPSDTSSLDRHNAVGFATDVGSHTSHTAIVARSMNLPAVVGLRDVSQHVRNGQSAILDGYSGTLVVEPSQQTLFVYGQLEVKRHSVEERLAALKDLPPQTLDGHRVTLSGNIELPADVPALLAVGTEGVGLFRTEFLYLNRKDFPGEQEQYEKYVEVARMVKPHWVIIRTLDIGGDKFHSEETTPAEINPFLGFRAIRFCLANPDIFTVQLRAILRASAEGNVKIMYPMISGVNEVIQANAILQEVMADLKKESVPFDENIDIGAMIEIPSAALTAEMIAQETDFLSIGSNDLIQYTMAVDRVNERVANLYEPTHPAILRLIRGVVEAAHNNNIWVGVCGEIAGEPLYVPLLVGMGVDELSIAAASLPRVKEVIRRMKLSEAQELAAATLHATRSREVLAMLNALIQRIDPDIVG